tara:strand:- start:799 stop:1551 length:753 start_codon:yes stop_codon:yes gene_type:complete
MNKKIILGNSNGNTFVIIENDNAKINSKSIKNMCLRYKTDALIHINNTNINNISMNYYNNDGTWETLCLNGLTCIGLVLQKKFLKNLFIVKCGPKKYKLNILKNGGVKLKVPEPIYKSDKIAYSTFSGFYIDSGAKHFVINIHSKWPNDDHLIDIAQKIRYDLKTFPDGINVNFYKKINQNTIEVKTYEKGIEKLMDSCSSGNLAAAFVFHNKQKNITVFNKGGSISITFGTSYQNNYLFNNAILNYINY